MKPSEHRGKNPCNKHPEYKKEQIIFIKMWELKGMNYIFNHTTDYWYSLELP